MAAVQFTNYFATELAAPVAPGDTSIQVLSDGNLGSLIVGGNWIYLTLVDANSWNNNLIPPQTREIVKVTAISGSAPDFILTVTRGQDNTTAQSFSRCDIAAFLLNAQSLYDIVGGGGSSVSITATAPVVVTPSPITGTGVISANVFVASGAGHKTGIVPDPGASGGTTKFLREDATWQVPAGGGSVSITATSPIIVTPSPITGTGVVSAIDMVGDSGSGGTHGLVPAPAAGDTAAGKFLKASGTWAVPPGGGAGSTLQSQEFTASGTYNVPANVTMVWVTMIGGGGGGSTTILAGTAGGGGGAGELCLGLPVKVVGAGTLTVTIGAKGTGGAAAQGSAQAGTAGGTTSVATVSTTFGVLGGAGGNTNATSGAGGGPGGSASKSATASGTLGLAETSVHFGGASGGGGGNSTVTNGGNGGPAGGILIAGAGSAASSQAGGGGGAASIWGVGGPGGNGGVAGTTATAANYGSGGGGSGGQASTTLGGGDGAPGYVLVEWIS